MLSSCQRCGSKGPYHQKGLRRFSNPVGFKETKALRNSCWRSADLEREAARPAVWKRNEEYRGHDLACRSFSRGIRQCGSTDLQRPEVSITVSAVTMPRSIAALQ